MKKLVCGLVVLGLATASLFADSATEQVQRTLKEQGFYYGEVTGAVNADTTAAIRRFQIRNGLQVTGELNAETRRALGVSGAPAATARSSATPAPEPAATPTAGTAPAPRVDEPSEPQSGYAPDPRRPRTELSGAFDGTPFEVAPPDVQQRAIVGAQTILMRRGYYRSGIDGKFGPATQRAVSQFQVDMGLQGTGRLDMDTLSALGLLPGEQAPGTWPQRRRFIRPAPRPADVAPNGEPIYDPRDLR